MNPTASIPTRKLNPDLGVRKLGYFLILLTTCFCLSLYELVRTALRSDIHSHVILIPVVSAYLLWIKNPLKNASRQRSTGWALGAGVLGLLCLVFSALFHFVGISISLEDNLTLRILAFVWWVIAGGFFILGFDVMRAAAFPALFLFFMVPLPSLLINLIEIVSQRASAEVASWLIALSGTSMIKTGVLIQLPGIVIQVGQECSGIRSSYVLFITSLLAGYLFLDKSAHRFWLSLAVVPLGLLRNGLRICTIALLCVYWDPTMIDSAIHRRGGPFFFVLSLIPLFLLLFWFRKRESRGQIQAPGQPSSPLQGQA
jgi:exosortase C (VPDSG-CTERM-specific)